MPPFPRLPAGFLAVLFLVPAAAQHAGPALPEPWGPEQATGAPDTFEADFFHTAWTPLEPDAGREWLAVSFARAVPAAEIRIRETLNPGAVQRVSALVGRRRRTLWRNREASTPAAKAPVDLVIAVDRKVVARDFAIEIRTDLRKGFEAIDAIELVGRDGSRQWAVNAAASSTYATVGGVLAWELSPEMRSFDDAWYGVKGRAPGSWIRANPRLLSAPGDILRAWTLNGATTITLSRVVTDRTWRPEEVLETTAAGLSALGAEVRDSAVREVAALPAAWLVIAAEGQVQHWVAIPRAHDILLLLLSAPTADSAAAERVFQAMLAGLEIARGPAREPAPGMGGA